MTPPTGTSLHLKQNGKFSFRGKVSSYKTGRHIQRDYILQWISLKIFKTRHTISHPDTRLGIPDQYFVDFSSFYLMNFPLKHKHFRLLPFRGKTFFLSPNVVWNFQYWHMWNQFEWNWKWNWNVKSSATCVWNIFVFQNLLKDCFKK